MIKAQPFSAISTRITEAAASHRWLIDVALLLILTIIAAVPRIVLLGEIPPGLHGDEAVAGLEARRILDTGPIGAFTREATGTPAGTFYWTAAVFGLFGDNAFTLRLSFALLGTITIPLAYLAFKVMFGRSTAVIGAFLLATSAWHLHFSRVAFVPIGWPLMEVATLLALFLALRHESRLLFALAGLFLGFGIYTYGGYPTFAMAVGAFLLWLAAFRYRRRLPHFVAYVAVLGGMALLAGLPMASYARDNPDVFTGRFKTYSVTKSPDYQAADNLLERGRVIGERETDYVRSVISEPIPDGADAAGIFPLVNRVMLGLLVVGGALAVWRWRSPAHAFLIIGIAAIAMGPAVTLEAPYRRSLGLTPLLAATAALPLALLWDSARRWGLAAVAAAGAAIALTVGATTAIDLTRYFGTYDDSPHATWVFARDLAEASRYLDRLPQETYVLFYYDRATFNYESRRFLAPDAQGEDRSQEFGAQVFRLDRDSAKDVLYMFLGRYLDQADVVQRLYPGGHRYTAVDGHGTVMFDTYLLPRSAAAGTPPGGAPPAGSLAGR